MSSIVSGLPQTTCLSRIAPRSNVLKEMAQLTLATRLNTLPFNEGKVSDCPTLGGARMGELVNSFRKLGSAHPRYARAVKR